MNNYENIIDNALPGKLGVNSYSFRNKELAMLEISKELKETAYPTLVNERVTGHQQHHVFNFIDLPELKKFVTQAKLSILDSYYINGEGQRIDETKIQTFHNYGTAIFSVAKVKKSN